MRNTNYFGRVCRFLGRINLFAGFILCLGISVLLIANPFVDKDSTIIKNSANRIANSTGVSHSFASNLFSQNQILSWFISIVIISIAIIAVIYLCKKYNAVVRGLIANLAKRTHTSIHMLELGLTLIIWSILLLMLLFSFPYAASVLIFPFVLNELFFLFGWISYGMPEYKV